MGLCYIVCAGGGYEFVVGNCELMSVLWCPWVPALMVSTGATDGPEMACDLVRCGALVGWC